ncbi:hypothetical protein TVAG_049940 [Trichomonas vaginalis G3]|uniref:Uncharacterized protein n=1 Tax=Trichomonas vaginalis (strain ATCC PRA-98 / G3) TaxID=412133 RepID=A2EVY9_TRIV3|nr:hypothetical protein TVAGG3_0548760 [Trichomonas vaginalis G3]EAY03210.1 hypothetical protein TVAG_049940 [Trichomonas vaginalis G3]KAI5520359.1 hypothetical protein TVAGG3_0548760 [Trichomonas vaginalis G3]|eukprot:XP_001315433.1 hypothetical protein [Trichomonas vaginalis G3]
MNFKSQEDCNIKTNEEDSSVSLSNFGFPDSTLLDFNRPNEVKQFIKIIKTKIQSYHSQNIIFKNSLLNMEASEPLLAFCLDYPHLLDDMLSIINSMIYCSPSDIKQLIQLKILAYFNDIMENLAFYPFFLRIIKVAVKLLLVDTISEYPDDLCNLSGKIFQIMINPDSIQRLDFNLVSEEFDANYRCKMQQSAFKFITKFITFPVENSINIEDCLAISSDIIVSEASTTKQKILAINLFSSILSHYPIEFNNYEALLSFIPKYIINISNVTKESKPFIESLTNFTHFLILSIDSNLILQYGFFDAIMKLYFDKFDVLDDLINLLYYGDPEDYILMYLQDFIHVQHHPKFNIIFSILIIKLYGKENFDDYMNQILPIIDEIVDCIDDSSALDAEIIIRSFNILIDYLKAKSQLDIPIENVDIESAINSFGYLINNTKDESIVPLIENILNTLDQESLHD